MANVDLKTPSEIAAQFAKFYYEKFDQNRAELAQLYVSLFFIFTYWFCFLLQVTPCFNNRKMYMLLD